MSTLTPFRAKARAYPTPIDMLRDLAALDATLVLTRESDDVYIGYELASVHQTRLATILSFLDGCGDTWTVRYLATVESMLLIEGCSLDLPIGTVRRLNLSTAFVHPLPATGTLAAQAVMALNDALDVCGKDDGDLRLALMNQRADVLRTIIDAAGTPYAVEAAAEAKLIASKRGMRL